MWLAKRAPQRFSVRPYASSLALIACMVVLALGIRAGLPMLVHPGEREWLESFEQDVRTVQAWVHANKDVLAEDPRVASLSRIDGLRVLHAENASFEFVAINDDNDSEKLATGTFEAGIDGHFVRGSSNVNYTLTNEDRLRITTIGATGFGRWSPSSEMAVLLRIADVLLFLAVLGAVAVFVHWWRERRRRQPFAGPPPEAESAGNE